MAPSRRLSGRARPRCRNWSLFSSRRRSKRSLRVKPHLDPRFTCFGMKLARSKIHRWGVYATERIPAGRKVIEYTGERDQPARNQAPRRRERPDLPLHPGCLLDPRWLGRRLRRGVYQPLVRSKPGGPAFLEGTSLYESPRPSLRAKSLLSTIVSTKKWTGSIAAAEQELPGHHQLARLRRGFSSFTTLVTPLTCEAALRAALRSPRLRPSRVASLLTVCIDIHVFQSRHADIARQLFALTFASNGRIVSTFRRSCSLSGCDAPLILWSNSSARCFASSSQSRGFPLRFGLALARFLLGLNVRTRSETRRPLKSIMCLNTSMHVYSIVGHSCSTRRFGADLPIASCTS